MRVLLCLFVMGFCLPACGSRSSTSDDPAPVDKNNDPDPHSPNSGTEPTGPIDDPEEGLQVDLAIVSPSGDVTIRSYEQDIVYRVTVDNREEGDIAIQLVIGDVVFEPLAASSDELAIFNIDPREAPEGSFELKVEASNEAGLKKSVSSNITIALAPFVEFVAPASDTVSIGEVEFSFAIFDHSPLEYWVALYDFDSEVGGLPDFAACDNFSGAEGCVAPVACDILPGEEVECTFIMEFTSADIGEHEILLLAQDVTALGEDENGAPDGLLSRTLYSFAVTGD